MKGKVYKVKSKVWVYPSMAGWHFLSVDRVQSAEIKKKFAPVRRGFGSLPIEVTLGKATWKTSIFPSKEGMYLLPLKSAVRRAEGVDVGDEVTFAFSIG